MPKKIALFGDSWGCGEWDTPSGSADSLRVVHAGLAEYLCPEFMIQNFSQAGASNWDILKKLQSYHEFNIDADQNADYVIVIQTSASRTSRADFYHVDYESLFAQHTEFVQICDALQEIWYVKLHELAEQFDKDIYVVGGLSDVAQHIIPLYPRLRVLCASWQKLLCESHRLSTAALEPEPAVLTLARSLNNMPLTTSILDYLDHTVHDYVTMMDQEGMGPADFHPSRFGHKILADHIKKQLAS
jgi:hypothetical protein